MKITLLTILTSFLITTSVVAAGNAIKLTPTKTSVDLGDTFGVTVTVTAPTQAMNAVSGSIVFPGNVSVTNITKGGGIINFWTEEPHVVGNRVRFEGIVLNPGFTGQNGKLFTITFTTKKAGSAPIILNDGAILANDGLGTNIIDSLGSTTITVKESFGGVLTSTPSSPTAIPGTAAKVVVLPVITEYSPAVPSSSVAFLKGKGEPNALTKIVFKNTAFKSVGERFLDFVQTKKTALDEVLVKNDTTGAFEYTTNSNLIAGVYNATPFLVDDSTNTERPGLGVQLLVNDSKIVHSLVVLINILGLLIPIVGLAVLVYFIPWYSRRKMRVLKQQLQLEEEKIQLSAHELAHKEKVIDKSDRELAV